MLEMVPLNLMCIHVYNLSKIQGRFFECLSTYRKFSVKGAGRWGKDLEAPLLHPGLAENIAPNGGSGHDIIVHVVVTLQPLDNCLSVDAFLLS